MCYQTVYIAKVRLKSVKQAGQLSIVINSSRTFQFVSLEERMKFVDWCSENGVEVHGVNIDHTMKAKDAIKELMVDQKALEESW